MSHDDVFIPYGRQTVEDDDIEAVLTVLRSDFLTTGPAVVRFEQALAEYCGVRHAVAVSSGTAALHAAMAALQIGPGDEVVVPALTFVATANCVRYCGGTVRFADIDPETGCIFPETVAPVLTERTKAVIAVDFAGHPAPQFELCQMCRDAGITFVNDAAHGLGGAIDGVKVGGIADLSTLSFHPVKSITTGEGGAVLTNDAELAERLRRFRNHGIDRDHQRRTQEHDWRYDVIESGYNYRLTDMQCALGTSQLRKLDRFVARRNQIAACYQELLSPLERQGVLRLPRVRPGYVSGWHLYVVRVTHPEIDRDTLFSALRAEHIGVNVHYRPVPELKIYRELCHDPVPETYRFARTCLSLPIFPAMTDQDVDRVAAVLDRILTA